MYINLYILTINAIRLYVFDLWAILARSFVYMLQFCVNKYSSIFPPVCGGRVWPGVCGGELCPAAVCPGRPQPARLSRAPRLQQDVGVPDNFPPGQSPSRHFIHPWQFPSRLFDKLETVWDATNSKMSL